MTDDFLRQFEQRRQERLQAERSFPLAGETLTYRLSVPPEAVLKLERERERWMLRETNGEGPAMTSLEMLQVVDETIIACLEPDCHDAYARLRDPTGGFPLGFAEVFLLMDYLIGKTSGLPTDAPADSSDGRTKTGSGSTEGSSSKASAPAA